MEVVRLQYYVRWADYEPSSSLYLDLVVRVQHCWD